LCEGAVELRAVSQSDAAGCDSSSANLIDRCVRAGANRAIRVDVHAVTVGIGRQSGYGYNGSVLLAIVQISFHHAHIAGLIGNRFSPDVIRGPSGNSRGGGTRLIDERETRFIDGASSVVPIALGNNTSCFGTSHGIPGSHKIDTDDIRGGAWGHAKSGIHRVSKGAAGAGNGQS